MEFAQWLKMVKRLTGLKSVAGNMGWLRADWENGVSPEHVAETMGHKPQAVSTGVRMVGNTGLNELQLARWLSAM
jgi:hypothetical protein